MPIGTVISGAALGRVWVAAHLWPSQEVWARTVSFPLGPGVEPQKPLALKNYAKKWLARKSYNSS